jgi:hypothetical protein
MSDARTEQSYAPPENRQVFLEIFFPLQQDIVRPGGQFPPIVATGLA